MDYDDAAYNNAMEGMEVEEEEEQQQHEEMQDNEGVEFEEQEEEEPVTQEDAWAVIR